MNQVETLLAQYRLTAEELARAADCTAAQAALALDIERFDTCPIVVLLRVRVRLEALLRERGWRGNPAELWREFDERFEAQVRAQRAHRTEG